MVMIKFFIPDIFTVLCQVRSAKRGHADGVMLTAPKEDWLLDIIMIDGNH
jgi:hypothetical protein